ncbi:hypothetical protein ACEN2Y_00675 (plasmid) [Ralstonia solanacearum]|uniref:hypothetical protein n=1 Tax=Ralstonia solanacearum TaxID=305 RepID=UPI0032165C35
MRRERGPHAGGGTGHAVDAPQAGLNRLGHAGLQRQHEALASGNQRDIRQRKTSRAVVGQIDAAIRIVDGQGVHAHGDAGVAVGLPIAVGMQTHCVARAVDASPGQITMDRNAGGVSHATLLL